MYFKGVNMAGFLCDTKLKSISEFVNTYFKKKLK